MVVLDDGPIGGGETGRTTAHLSNALDDRYYELERLFGTRGAQLAAESHTVAIDCMESIIAEEGMHCDFERLDGYLFTPPDAPREILVREWEAAHRAGLTEVAWVDKAPLRVSIPGRACAFPARANLTLCNTCTDSRARFCAVVVGFLRPPMRMRSGEARKPGQDQPRVLRHGWRGGGRHQQPGQ